MRGEPESVRFASGGLELYGRLRHCAGEAPTLVLLSGLGFHTFEYEPLATELAARGLTSLSFDFRGHGRSDGPRGRWTLDELAADSRQAIEFASRRCAGRICLFGNSLGAMVAIPAGARDDRVLGVVAANCPARVADFMLTRPRRALFAAAKLAAPIAPVRIGVGHFFSYEQLIDDRSWISTIENDPLIGDARRLSAGTYSTLIEDWDGPAAVESLHKPLLLIQGRRDRFQPPRQSELVFQAAHDPKRCEIMDTGHLPHLEAPEVLAALLAEWVGGL